LLTRERGWIDELREVGEQPRVESVAEEAAERRGDCPWSAQRDRADVARRTARRLVPRRRREERGGQKGAPREAGWDVWAR